MTLDLASLVEQLRRHGFRVDTRQYLTAHDLLLASAARGRRLEDDPRALGSHLGPIFCTSPEEQVRFAQVIAGWSASGPSSDVPEPSPGPSRAPKAFAAWKRRAWLLPVLALVLSAGTIGAFLYHRHVQPIVLQGVVRTIDAKDAKSPAPGAIVTLDGRAVAVDAQGGFVVSVARRDGSRTLAASLAGHVPEERTIDVDTGSPIELALRRPEPPPPTSRLHIGAPVVVRPPPSVRASTQTEHRVSRSQVALAALGVALLTYSLLLLGHRLRRRLVLRGLPVRSRPDFATLSDDTAFSPSDRELKRLTSALRRPREEDVTELDLRDSVEATARGGGFFSPVYATRRTIPEYLALVRRENPADHQARLADEMVTRLRERGLAVERYFFHDDPRICTTGEPPFTPRSSHELLARHYRAALLLFIEADSCFHPLTGRMQRWVEALQALPRRVVLTPAVPYEWGRAESELARHGFVVLPATMEGLLSYAEVEGDWRIESFFPAPYARPFPSTIAAQPWRWLDRAAPPTESVEKLLRQLRGYLGGHGFTWLAACAVYPEIAWPLTLQLAEAVNGSPDRPLASLARLPWFRHGFMPDWLRRVLIGHLSDDDERAVRLALERRLETLARETLDGRHRPTERGLRIGGFVNALDIVRTSPADSPMQDAVFVGYMEGARPDPTLVEAPGILRRLFRKIGRFEDERLPIVRERSGSWPRRAFARIRTTMVRHPNLVRMIGSTAAAGALLPMLRIPLTEPIDRSERLVSAVAFNSQSTILATASSDGAVCLFDVASGKLLGDPVVHGGRVHDVQFSPDGSRFVSASEDHTARLWDVATRQAIGEPLVHEDAVVSVRFTRNGDRFVTASKDGTARVWDGRTGRPAGQPMRHGSAVLSAEFGSNGRRVLTGAQDGSARLWDTQQEELIRELRHGDGGVFARFSPDNRLILTLGADRAGRVWDALTGRRVTEIQTEMSDEGAHSAEFSPDGARVLTSSAQVCDARSGQLLFDLPARTGERLVFGARFSPNGQWIVTADNQARPQFWDAATSASLGDPLANDERPLRAIEFGTDGKLLAVAGGNTVSIWPLQEPVSPGPQLAILEFTASPARISQGQRARLCVLLQGAWGAVIDPGVEYRVGDTPGTGDLVNGVRRCIAVQPSRTTSYTLQAFRRGDPQGVSRSTTVVVAAQGWCCVSGGSAEQRMQQNARIDGGKVFQSTEDECKKMGGQFADSEKEASTLCYRPAGAKAD